MGYSSDIIENLKQSFIFNKKTWITYGLDILYLLSIGILFYVWALIIGSTGKKVFGTDPDQFQKLVEENGIQNLHSGLAEMFGMIIVATLIIFILYLLISSLIKGSLWHKLLGKTFKKKEWWRYTLLNAFIMTPLFFLFFALAVSFTAKGSKFFVFILPFFVHFTNFINIEFVKQKKVRKSIKNGLYKSIMRFPKLIIPYIIMMALMAIIDFSWRLSSIPNSIVPAVIFILIFILWISWTRNFFYLCYKKI